MLNANVIGYCLDDKSLHVCGYQAGKVLIQTKAGSVPKKLTIYSSNKGNYFVLNDKRHYLPKVFV